MALTVARAGPTVWCSSTAASAILRRVSWTRSALRFISYFRAIVEIITQTCAFNLDSWFVLCHCSLHTVVQGKEREHGGYRRPSQEGGHARRARRSREPDLRARAWRRRGVVVGRAAGHHQGHS